MKEMGVAYEKNSKKNFKIAESEVSKGSVAQMNIKNLMLCIENYEEAIDQGDLNINTIQTLTTLYPRAIEYFSAFDNNMYNDLLNRMQSLLQREDIQMVLNSVQAESTSSPSQSPSTSAKQESPAPADQQQKEAAAQKAVIDFNVSEEDMENHRKELEEQKQQILAEKAQEEEEQEERQEEKQQQEAENENEGKDEQE